MKLTNQDYFAAADLLKVDPAVIMAVTAIESKGKGFLPDGNPKILFEPFQFGRITKHLWDGAIFHFDKISYPISLKGKWSVPACKYGSEKIQHHKLKFAEVLDRNAAYESCSWGLFQIMGFNSQLCGYSKVTDYVEAMAISEGKHLEAFCRFLISCKLDDELRDMRLTDFAKLFNGKAYHKNTAKREDDYDYIMLKYYKEFKPITDALRAKIDKANFEYFMNVQPLPMEMIKKISL